MVVVGGVVCAARVLIRHFGKPVMVLKWLEEVISERPLYVWGVFAPLFCGPEDD